MKTKPEILTSFLKNNFFLIVVIAFVFTQKSYSQQITVNSSLTAQELIENHLVQGCVSVTNIVSTVNGSPLNLSSFGAFSSASSNFPINDGIVLTTGSASSAGNTVNNNLLNEGDTSWGTDPDLETALGINNTFNATSIEFDFMSVSNQIQFQYILASEEYAERYLCNNADSFVFLIKETGSLAPYTNVATIPGTSTPVSTNSIHPEIFGFCPAENESFFDGYNMGDTNYDGRTVPLTATTNITPYVQYHVKLIIAEQFDSNYDSAVFIQGNSFNPEINLGEDITTCADAVTLNADIGNSQANYVWYLDGTVITDEDDVNLTVTQSGIYTVEISIPLNGISCIIEDDIDVAISSVQSADPIPDFEICDDSSNDGFEIFDLSLMDSDVIASVPPGNYSISYHNNLVQAQANSSPITTPITNTGNPQTIYVRIEDTNSTCLAYAPINLVVLPAPTINVTPLSVCDPDNDGFAQFDLTIKDAEIINGQPNLLVSYHATQADADSGNSPIASPYTNTSTPSEQLFIRVINTLTGCVNTEMLQIDVNGTPIINETDPIFIDACDTDHDGWAAFNLTEITNQVLQGLTNVTVTFYETQADAEIPQNEIPNPTNYSNIVQHEQIVFIRVEDNTTGCATVRSFEIHSNLLLTATRIQTRHICDQDNDGVEEVSLPYTESFIINLLEDVDITFFSSLADQQNNVNALDETIPLTLTTATSPQTLYITLESLTCTETAEIELILTPVQEFTSIQQTTYCDTDDDGFTTIDLSTLDDLVTNNTPGYEVLYFLSQDDADNNENQLPTLYNNVSNPFELFVRIRESNSGCASKNSFELTVLPAPTVTQPSTFLVCDNDQDSIFTIDLTSKISEIVTSTSGLNISFFTDIDDANANSNPINNPDNYTTGTQTIYIRIENSTTFCFAIETLDILVSPLPIANPNISNYVLCEDDNDHTSEFLLNTKDTEILNGQTDMEVSYYTNQQDAIDRVFPIDKNNLYTNMQSPELVYFRIENIADINCFSVSSFSIEVSPNPIFNAPTNLVVCDSDGSNDGFFEFDFNEVINNITQGSTQNLTVTFHLSQTEAEDNQNQLPLLYTNTTPNQQIFTRIENSFSCFKVEEFGLNTLIVPEVTSASPMAFCDTNYDGIFTFDITAADYEILDIRQDNLTINYYRNLDDLDTQTNPIPNPTTFQNTSNPQTVFISIYNTETTCYAVVPVELSLDLPPVINTTINPEICDNETNSYTLSDTDQLIVSDTSLVNISYHINNNDAENNINPLNNNYTYSSNNDTIYVRVEDLVTSCHIVTFFTLTVNPNPIANQPPNLDDCDDDLDSMLFFNLAQQTAIILGTQDATLNTISYFETENDAITNMNAIQDLNYNATNQQTFFARIENNTTGCYSTTSFNTIIYRKPDVSIPDQTVCLDNLPLVVSAETGFVDDTYLWSTNATTSTIDITTIGTYSVTVTSINNCRTTSTFNVIESEKATIEFTETVDFSNPNNITVTISGIGNYLYVLDHGLPQTSNVFYNVTLGPHTIEVIDLNGCDSATKDIVIIDAPLFFTPNNDGYNDTWHITGVEQLEGTVVYIFDRYGKLLKTLNHNSLGWDGTYRGENMPSNDYWFLAEVKKGDISFEVKRHFSLKR